MKEKFFVALIVILSGAFLALGWQHHQIRPFIALTHPFLAPATFDPKENGVEVQVKLLSHSESKKLLGHDLLNENIQPLQITIHNNSPKIYVLSRDGVELKQIEAKKVAKKLYYNTIPRAVAFRVFSFLFWPFMVPSTIDSIHSYYSYRKMRKDFEVKALKEEMIPVYATFHRILFIPSSEMKETFHMTVIEESSKSPSSSRFKRWKSLLLSNNNIRLIIRR